MKTLQDKYRFIRLAPEGGDCTAPYDIVLSQGTTVREFIEYVLRTEEWGEIKIKFFDHDNPDNFYRREEVCIYSHGTLTTEFPDYILDKTIKYASSAGGWSNMDYLLVLNEED